jgi:hypothetical protein
VSKRPPPSESATIETDFFEHRTVKTDFINPCCFGQDFAAWLQKKLLGLAEFSFEEPFMEDYGWCFLARHNRGVISVALSYAHDGPIDGPATWVITIEWSDVDWIRRWFRQPDEAAFAAFATSTWDALQSEPGIRFIGFGNAN